MSKPPYPYLIARDAPPDDFPPTEAALAEPNGLIALGGDLSPNRLLAAYRRGIFPWYEDGQPILWWTPDPRLILNPRRLHLSRSLHRTLRKRTFTTSVDQDFAGIISACAAPRKGLSGTWITTAMRAAYQHLHRLGQAHSIEVRHGNVLAGGLYGISIGTAFFGESMFSRESDASKVALVELARLLAIFPESLIDCQVPSAHLLGLGAELIPRFAFMERLYRAVNAQAGSFPLPK